MNIFGQGMWQGLNRGMLNRGSVIRQRQEQARRDQLAQIEQEQEARRQAAYERAVKQAQADMMLAANPALAKELSSYVANPGPRVGTSPNIAKLFEMGPSAGMVMKAKDYMPLQKRLALQAYYKRAGVAPKLVELKSGKFFVDPYTLKKEYIGEAPPKGNKTTVYDPSSGNPIVEMTPAGLATNEGKRTNMPGGAPTKKTLNDLQGNVIKGMTVQDAIKASLKGFKHDYLTLPGRMFYEGLNKLEGMGLSLSPENKKKLAEFDMFKSSAAKNLVEYVKYISGAQVAEKEYERLAQAFPTVNPNMFKTDNPTQFLAKAANIINMAMLANARYRAFLGQNLRAPKDASELLAYGASLQQSPAGNKILESYGYIPITPDDIAKFLDSGKKNKDKDISKAKDIYVDTNGKIVDIK